MIDVVLKVGELKGGMAEGSIVTYQPHGVPLSKNMETVFAILEVEDDQLPLVEDAFASRKRVHRRHRLPLHTLALALGRPLLEKEWRSRDPVQPVDARDLNLRKFMRRGYNVRKPKHEDLNAVSSGKYTVGKKANYSDWNAALADISSNIGDELIFTQISHLSYAMAGVMGDTLIEGPNARLVLRSASVHQGNGAGALEIENTSGNSIGIDLKCRAATGEAHEVEIQDLYFLMAGLATPGSAYPMLKTQKGVGTGDPLTFLIHDCIFYGSNKNSMGVDQTDTAGHRFKIWNCKFAQLKGGIYSDAALNINIPDDGISFVENCTFYNNNNGIRSGVPTMPKINNCVSYANSNTDFSFTGSPGDTKGDNNVSSDGTAASFDGSNNQYNIPAATLNNEFENSSIASAEAFVLKSDASVLPAAGRIPEISENVNGSRGNVRPGSDGTYSVGADEIKEAFPSKWRVVTKLTVNKDKVSGAGTVSLPILITEAALAITDELWNASRPDGADLRLSADAAGSTPLPLEVVEWDRTNKKCELWAKFDISSLQDTTVYLWAGSGAAGEPEPADPAGGRFLVWNTATPAGSPFVYHFSKTEDDDRYVFDSSPAMNHAPIIDSSYPPQKVTSPWGFGHAITIEESANRFFDFGNVYNFTAGQNRSFATALLQHLSTATLSMMRFSRTTGSDDRFNLLSRSGGAGLAVRAQAPDGSTIVDRQANIDLTDLQRHVVAVAVNLPSQALSLWSDGVEVTYSSLGFGASNYTSTSHQSARIGHDSGSGYAYLDELRYHGNIYGSELTDEYYETHHTMITEQAAFWTCGPLYGQYQDGARSWKFIVPEMGCIGVENTDFWVEHIGNANGELSSVLHGIWDAGSLNILTRLNKRFELEERLGELRHEWQSLRGDLILDEGTAIEKLIVGVQLSGVTVRQGDNNAAIEYDLTFSFGIQALGMKSIARSFEFDGLFVGASNFLVEYIGEDRTVFKPVFRAAPVRIESGPVNKLIQITAIMESIAASTPLARRQQAEGMIKDWVWNRLGKQGELKIDGVSFGTAHLSGVLPSRIELPDAVVYDLEFVTGYGS